VSFAGTALTAAKTWYRANPVYNIAVAISIISAGFGLAREFVFLHLLGFSTGNDQLQYYLSIVYTVSLLGDPVRLTSMNILQRSDRTALLSVVGIVAIVAASGVSLAYFSLGTGVQILPLFLAAAAGVANLVAVALLVYRQRYSHFLLTHLITVSPNYIILVGVVLIHWWFAPRADLVLVVVSLFCLAPIFQITALTFMRNVRAYQPPGRSKGETMTGLHNLGMHSLSAVGSQGAQIVIRTGFAHSGSGALTIFSLVIRVFDTLRAVFVDSLIGSRMAAWARGDRHIPALLDPRRVRKPGFVVLAVMTLAVALVPSHENIQLAAQLAIVLGVSLWLSSMFRLLYYFVNSTVAPRRLIVRLGAVDIFSAMLLAAAVNAASARGAILVWVFYIARYFIQIELLTRFPLPTDNGETSVAHSPAAAEASSASPAGPA
jgi:hypothetical protein